MGMVAGLLGCIVGILGILISGLIFVPLAALCMVIGLRLRFAEIVDRELRGILGCHNAKVEASPSKMG